MATNTNSLDFDSASSERVEIASPSGLNGLTTMTVELWAKPETLALNRGFIGRSNGGTTNQFTFATDGTTNTKIQISIANALDDWFGNFATTSDAIMTAGTWTHHAMVYNGGGSANADRLKYYADAVEKTLTFNGTIPTALTSPTLALNIAIREQTTNFFNGLIDEVRIWNTARTATQLSNNKDTEISATSSGLIYYWKFNDGAGTTATATTGGIDGSLINTPVWSTDVPFTPGFVDAVVVLNRSYSFFM